MSAVDLFEAYALPARAVRTPFVRCNMVSTLDGATSVQGRSGPLGGPADRRVFHVLRSLADVVLVGAGTVRSERYGPARLDDDLRVRRISEGRSPVPPIAVVTGSGDLDWRASFFTDAEVRPLVFVAGAARRRIGERAQRVANVVVAGEERVDPRLVLEHLGRAGHRSVLLEGGPTLNSAVLRAGLLDELCLTMPPRLVAGDGPRLVTGPELARPLELEIVHLLEEDGLLFFRLAVPRS
ncbi:MAG: pyrimidine reductase family protein [Actinomycetota bacterium]|jgi:riboflavin-specific deaminase-like protein|nr:pyrimidine reductase family protein [Actinomycetota bacterium]